LQRAVAQKKLHPKMEAIAYDVKASISAAGHEP
jgi:hypothetical protein